jgi:hypothetical protein
MDTIGRMGPARRSRRPIEPSASVDDADRLRARLNGVDAHQVRTVGDR